MNDLDNISEPYKQYFNGLNVKYQKFIIYRGRGLTLENAWVGAGMIKKNARANASSWLKNNPDAQELVKMLQTNNQLKALSNSDSPISKEILDNSQKGLTALQIAKTKTGEEAVSLNFYLDVVRGKIKTTEKTTTTDSEGKQVVKVVEKEPSIQERMKAREKIDQLLGIANYEDKLGQVDLPNGMQITIVDVSNKEMKDESVKVMDAEVVEDMEEEEDVN